MKRKSTTYFSTSRQVSSLTLITFCALGIPDLSNAQTWINSTTGISNWSTATNWDTAPTAPVSGPTTAVQFFATPGTVIPAASAIVANQDIATPMILNSLTVNGTGPSTGAAPSTTISGGTIQFAGTSPSLNVSAGFGTVGYTVNLNSNLDFSADTAVNFSSGGAFINVGTSVNLTGAGAITFTGGLTNRPLSLSNGGNSDTTGSAYTGNVFVTGANSVLQLNAKHNILGLNLTPFSQTVSVASGSAANLSYGNGAYRSPQNFVVSGTGNAASAGAVLNVTRIGFGNGLIGGLALPLDATVRTSLEIASEARGITIARGIVGTGKLTKTGTGYLFPTVGSPTSVTWAGTEFLAYTGNVEIREGAIQTPGASNALGPNTATTQRVTVSSGASMIIGAANNAWTQPQNIILNGNGTGYVANNGGLAALDSFGAGFGSNTVRRIVVATDSSVAVKRDGSSTGLTRGLTTQQGLSGTGNLTVGAPYGNATSPLYLGQAASAFEEFPAFSGKVIINNGIVNIGNTDALGAFPTGQVTLNELGALSSSLAGGLDQTFLSRIDNLSTTGGAVCLGNNSSNNLDLSGAPNLRLGAIGSFTYSGTLTPVGGVYRLGGGGGTLTVSSPLTGSNSVVISGGVVLSNGGNDFDGGITIAGNNTGLGQSATLGLTGGIGSLPTNAISFGGTGGTFSFNGAPDGTIQALDSLAFTAGHATISSTYGTSGNSGISYTSLTRNAGATGNFATANSTSGVTADSATDIITAGATAVMANGLQVTFGGTTVPTGLTAGTQYFVVNASGNTYQVSSTLGGLPINFSTNGTSVTQTVIGTNGTLNKISVAGLATGFVDKGAFFGDFNYAYNDAAGFLRAPAYGTDAGFVTSGATTSLASATHQNISGSISAQTSATFTTFKIAGAFGVTMAADQILTVDGILKSGGNAGTISGTGTAAIRALTGSEMVIRSQASGDGLTISIPVLANGASSLTKTGAGSLTLSAANTYTGATTIVAGTLTVATTGSLEDSAAVTVNGGTYATNSSTDVVGTVTLKNGVIGGTGTHQASSYAVENGMVTARLGGSGSLTKTTPGQVILAGVNSYSGGTTISAGTLSVTTSGRLDDFGTIAISGGSTYELAGADTVGDVTLTNGTIRGPGALNASFYAVEQGTISAPLAGTGTINKSTSGTVTLSGLNTLVGDVVIGAGTLVLADNARLNFLISDSSATNTVSGTGTATFDGDFEIDLTSGAPALTPGNEWQLVQASGLTESYGSTFNIPGFTETANVWTKTDGLYKWTFTEATGVLKLSSLAGYPGWITGFGLPLGDQDLTDDPDFDGINNLMEYVLRNGQPAVSSTSILPTLDASGANFVFTLYRRNDSVTDTTQIFQYGTNLSDWTSVAIPGGAGVTVTPNDPASGIDKVEISVVKAPNTKLFGRLKVTTP